MVDSESSYYAKFRCAIALAWVDESFDEKQREVLATFIQNGGRLTEEYKAQLLKDLHTKIPFEESWKQVTDIYDRAHLIDMADVIFKADGHYNDAEKLCYEKMKSEHMAAIDHDELRLDIETNRHKTAEREKALEEILRLKMLADKVIYMFR